MLQVIAPLARLVLGTQLGLAGIIATSAILPSIHETSWIWKGLLGAANGLVVMLAGRGSLYEWDGGGRSAGVVSVISGALLSTGSRCGYGKRRDVGVLVGVGMALVGSVVGEMVWWEVGVIGLLGLLVGRRRRRDFSRLGRWRWRFAVVATLWYFMLYLEGMRMWWSLIRRKAYPHENGFPMGHTIIFVAMRELLALAATMPAWIYGISVLGLLKAPKKWGLGVEGWFVLLLSNLLPSLLSHFTPVIVLGIGGGALLFLTSIVEARVQNVSHKII